jgi:hypothetical protein
MVTQRKPELKNNNNKPCQKYVKCLKLKIIKIYIRVGLDSRATKKGSWTGEKFLAPPLPPARANRLGIFTLNRKDRLSVPERLGFGLKGLIGTIDKQ